MQKTFSERCNLLLMMRMNVFQITDPYRPMYEIYARWSLKKNYEGSRNQFLYD